MEIINSFGGEYNFLSNFSRHGFWYAGIWYRTSEHFYQAEKAVYPHEREKIVSSKTPAESKRLARKCSLKSNWEDIKINVMRKALKLKFNDPKLRDKLLKTGSSILIEGNTWHDNFWGDCTCKKCEDISGLNMLGNLLMEIRCQDNT